MMKRLGSLHRTLLGKILLVPIGILIVFYITLFTPLGNRMSVTILEKILTSTLSEPITLHEFVLTHNRFHFILQDNEANTLSMQGGFSLLTLRLYAHYRLECFHQGGINPINAPLKTDGALSGGIGAFDIHGNGDIFNGTLMYQIQLHRFKLGTLYLKLNGIGYEPLLQLMDYPSKTDTKLSGEIDLRGFDTRDLQGSIRLNTRTNTLTPTPIQEDDNSSFDLKALLKDENGEIKPFNVNVSISASVENLGILEQFAGIHMGTSATLDGTLQGDETLLHINLQSAVADSDTTLKMEISKLEPSLLTFEINHAHIEKLFALFALPAPIKGIGDLSGDLNASEGHIGLKLTKGATVPDILKREYNITQPPLSFNADISADMNPNGVRYKGSLTSDLRRMQIDSTTTHDQMLRDLLKSLH